MQNTMTIYALASGSGKAGVAVIRISGSKAKDAVYKLCGEDFKLTPRKASLALLRDPHTQQPIDKALVLYFAAPNSFTGEDIVELHLHGGRAIIRQMLGVLGKIEGFRLAEAGEFSKRAFLNGKMDLTAAEGLADLIDAETLAQKNQAFRQMQGNLATLYEAWREKLLTALAYMEAAIDFADEELPDNVTQTVQSLVDVVFREISQHLDDGKIGERLREGYKIAVIGSPNAGKSSLINKLAKRDVAIVSDIEGTTRDVIEVHLDIVGYPIIICDTAGIRETRETIEAEGVRRALARAEEADLVLVVLDGSKWGKIAVELPKNIPGNKTMFVLNKCDLNGIQAAFHHNGFDIYPISARNGDGLEPLLTILGARVEQEMELSEAPIITRERHRQALTSCLDHLGQYRVNEQTDLAAEDLRLAMRHLGSITGRVDIEHLLDKIFADFCLGK